MSGFKITITFWISSIFTTHIGGRGKWTSRKKRQKGHLESDTHNRVKYKNG